MVELVTALEQAHRESPSWRLYGLCHQAATRIAELEAENARLTRERDEAQTAHIRLCEVLGIPATALSYLEVSERALAERAGGVKVRHVLVEAREFVSAVFGENQPARSWAYELRGKIDIALSALTTEPAAPEGPTTPVSIRAWRIKKSEPIPQWLEKTENAELTAGCDLIVIEAEDGGFDVYRSDPNSFANMMEGTRPDPHKHATVTGAPTSLRAPTALWAQINKLQAEIAELTRAAPEGPQEAAVTEAMVEAAANQLGFGSADSVRIRAALKAAMEAGR